MAAWYAAGIRARAQVDALAPTGRALGRRRRPRARQIQGRVHRSGAQFAGIGRVNPLWCGEDWEHLLASS